ncbi:MAG: HAD domain-containing protein [Muribaculum sp.]|nr:HAD domain-containing protein [Muribaculum sp.]
MKIIFLDFDGVMDTASYCSYLERKGMPECDLNRRPYFDPKCIKYLQMIIDATGADVVVSSDWKYIDSYGDLIEMWKERGLPGFITDVTPNVSKHRGDEIDRWLEECKTSVNYVILDDLDSSCFNKHQLPFLITINPNIGLDYTSACKAIEILNHIRFMPW